MPRTFPFSTPPRPHAPADVPGGSGERNPAGSVLVIHPGALGDVLLALPALAHLGHLCRGSRRVLATAPRLAALLGDAACVEAAVPLDGLALHRLFVADPDPVVLASLAGHRLVVSWLGAGDPAFRGHLTALAAAGGPRVVLGRGTPPPGSGRHAAWHFVDTLAELGPPPPALPDVRLVAGRGERAWAADWLAERALGTDPPVLLHPGAGSPGKVWPGMAGLARRLAAAGAPLLVVTGPAEAPGPETGLGRARLARDLTLRQLVALFERAAVFVGHDSGLTHLAAAVGCPTVALFGPTDPRVWAPVGPGVTVVAGAGPGAVDPWAGIEPAAVERLAREAAATAARRDRRAPVGSPRP